ncbi:MAG: protein-export chaperone SecB [Methyloceanibacter sp.]|uniref:protein-export chaperone SecB n=1 Tax=Methyloceanibacter sp. TaxID=1965321 RepID=UPI003D6D8EB6
MAKKETDKQAKKTNGDGPVPERPEEAPAAAAPSQAAGTAARAPTEAQLAVLAQYVKDLSFESPGAPQTLQAAGQNPQLKVGVNVNAGPRGEDVYEVALHIEAHAKSDAGVIYNVEIAYGGLFRLRNIPQHLLQPVLFVDCPTILFPFVRRVIADVVRDGGFPPLMLDPIDFGRLYTQNLARGQQPEQPQAKN